MSCNIKYFAVPGSEDDPIDSATPLSVRLSRTAGGANPKACLPATSMSFSCLLCGKKFKASLLRSLHVRLAHSRDPHSQRSSDKYHCSLFPQGFSSRASRSAHINSVHMGKSAGLVPSCAVRDPVTAASFLRPSNQQFRCAICPRHFYTLNGKRQHEDRGHKEYTRHFKGKGKNKEVASRKRILTFTCKYCSFVFNHRTAVVEHMALKCVDLKLKLKRELQKKSEVRGRINAMSLPLTAVQGWCSRFMCGVCLKRFRTKADFMLHMGTHAPLPDNM